MVNVLRCDTGGVAKKEQGGDPETVTLRVPLPKQVADDLVALAELYHATPERMVASWAQTHVENLMAGLPPGGAHADGEGSVHLDPRHEPT